MTFLIALHYRRWFKVGLGVWKGEHSFTDYIRLMRLLLLLSVQ